MEESERVGLKGGQVLVKPHGFCFTALALGRTFFFLTNLYTLGLSSWNVVSLQSGQVFAAWTIISSLTSACGCVNCINTWQYNKTIPENDYWG